MDPRVVYWSIWAVGSLVAWSIVFERRRRHYQQHRDPASLREALEAFGLFLVALAAFLGLTAALFLRGEGLGALLFAISAGIFFVVGVYSVFERMPDNGGHAARRQ